MPCQHMDVTCHAKRKGAGRKGKLSLAFSGCWKSLNWYLTPFSKRKKQDSGAESTAPCK